MSNQMGVEDASYYDLFERPSAISASDSYNATASDLIERRSIQSTASAVHLI